MDGQEPRLISRKDDPVEYAKGQAKIAAMSDGYQAEMTEWIFANQQTAHLLFFDALQSLSRDAMNAKPIADPRMRAILYRVAFIGWQRCLEGIERAIQLEEESA